MKKILITVIVASMLLMQTYNSFSQVSTANNFGGVGDYLGWDGTMSGITLKLKTSTADDMEFFTNSPGGFTNLRMIIKGNNTIGPLGSNNTGWIGIGYSVPLTHVHIGDGTCDQECDGSYPGTWRPWMKEGYFVCSQTDDLYLGLKDSTADHRDAVIAWGDNNRHNTSWGPDHLRFIFSEYCDDTSPDPRATSYNGLEVARVTPEGYWGIGTDFYISTGSSAFDPVRRLEIVDSLDQAQLRLDFSNGNYGTSYNYSDFKTTSVGNLLIDPENVNLHAAKRVGIGPLATFGNTEPAAKLEVLDGSGTAQLRLTNTLTVSWNDLFVTPTADLNIRAFTLGLPFTNASTATGGTINKGRVGINLPLSIDPANTLEINSNVSAASGLRFTKLSSVNPPATNPSAGVLSLNASGDVIWVLDAGGTSTLSACGGALPVGYITKATAANTVCDSKIFEDGTQSYQAIGYTGGFPAKFSVKNITATTINTGIYTEAPQRGVRGLANGIIGGGNAIVGVYGTADGTINTGNRNTGVYGEVNNSLSSAFNYGVQGLANVNGAYQNQGVNGDAEGASNYNIGVKGVAVSKALTGTNHNWAVAGEANGHNAATTDNIGVRGYAFDGVGLNGGIVGIAEDGTMAVGVSGTAKFSDGTVGQNIGVSGEATTTSLATSNYGVYGHASNSNFENFGVFGKVSGGIGTDRVGVFGEAPNLNVWSIFSLGKCGNTSGIWSTSDSILKTDIAPLENAKAIVEQLKPKTYYYDTVQYDNFNFPTEFQYGLLAQDVEEVLPSLVAKMPIPSFHDSLGNALSDPITTKVLNYTAFIPILIAAFQEQDKVIETLKEQLNALQIKQDSCCKLSSKGFRSNSENENESSSQSVELKSSQSNFLGQSVPNPHNTNCTIPYRIAASAAKAEILFSDQLGAEISRVEIIGRGTGQLTVLSSQLEDGLYTYSLIVDGKLIDTKKMVKQH